MTSTRVMETPRRSVGRVRGLRSRLRRLAHRETSHRFLRIGRSVGLSLACAAALYSIALHDGFQGSVVRRWSPLASVFSAAEANAWWLLTLLVVGSGLTLWVSRLPSRPPVWRAVDLLLEAYRDRVFRRQDGSGGDYGVTLYRHVRWNLWPFAWEGRLRFLGWPWEGWLTAVAWTDSRSGQFDLWFRVPKDGARTGGVAGSCWSKQGMLVIQNLPDVTRGPAEESIADYAVNTRTPSWWVRERRPLARSFCGLPVETDGRPWGVLLFDSRDRSIDVDEVRRFHRDVARILGGLLSEL